MDSFFFFAFALIPFKLCLYRTASHISEYLNTENGSRPKFLRCTETMANCKFSCAPVFNLVVIPQTVGCKGGGFWFSWGQIKASKFPCWPSTRFLKKKIQSSLPEWNLLDWSKALKILKRFPDNIWECWLCHLLRFGMREWNKTWIVILCVILFSLTSVRLVQTGSLGNIVTTYTLQ